MVIEHVAVWFPWLTNKLNGVGQPISIVYKILRGFNQVMFRTYNSENLGILDLSSFYLCLRTGLRCHIA